ncbi:MAG: FtsX-like permease family protein [Planctomycetia bacterium]|nr:FtsX-like permease family protein [Planctomycetia bacterium]
MYKLLLCQRYLRTRFIALASIISVMLGVATMIVVNSVMSGFGTEMRNRIHAILADVVVETISLDGAPDPDRWTRVILGAGGDDISAMAATVEVYGMMTFEYRGQSVTKPVTLIGIQPETKASVFPDGSSFPDSLDSYTAIRKQGKLIRPPLRGKEVPPGWELTAEAIAYRRNMVERQRIFMEQRQYEQEFERRESKELDDETPFEASDAVAKSKSRATGADPFANRTVNESENAKSPEFGAHDPVMAEVDQAAPQTARIIPGAGLIEFLYEDRETGEKKTMRMQQPGDDVMISTVKAGRPEPCRFHATIVDVLKTGMSENDSSLVFCNLEELQRARGMIDPESGIGAITSIQIKLKNYERSAEIVKRLEAALPPGLFSVRTWEQKQGPLLAAVEIEKAILNVLLFLIIAVAGFGILAIFYMIVVEKTRDIGILKALGASSRGVMTIFLSYGLALGIVGSGVGVVLGLLFVHYINEIEAGLTWVTGRKIFDETIYYFPKIPTDVSVLMVVTVALAAMGIAVLASVLPARRASKLHPVEALRYE